MERMHLVIAVWACAVAAAGAAGQDAAVASKYRRVDVSREEMRREIAARAVREYAGPRGALRPTGRDGCALLLDDFNDGNADGWATYDYTSGPVQAAVVNGRYVMSRAAGGNANPWQWFGASWAASNGNFATYFDGTMGLTFRITEPGTTFLAFARGFGAQYVVQSSWDGNYYLLINPGGEGMFDYAGLAYTPFNLQIGIDYRMEVGFVGPNLSMKVWRVGDPEPAAPQLQAVHVPVVRHLSEPGGCRRGDRRVLAERRARGGGGRHHVLLAAGGASARCQSQHHPGDGDSRAAAGGAR